MKRGDFLTWAKTQVGRRSKLINVSRRGGVTLVVGAGISVARGLPNWDTLARDVWREAFGRGRSPWHKSAKGQSPRDFPQFLPIVFELAYRELGAKRFQEILRRNLYKKAQFPKQVSHFQNSDETLAVLARLIVQEYRRGHDRRIDAIVTLNADDLLERAVFALGENFGVVRVVARGTHSALRDIVSFDDRTFLPLFRLTFTDSLPVYHIHGFVPSVMYYGKSVADYMLVFTDTQYWSTSATAFAFANRVMLSALSESRCVFIGLSMTDINLLRWFALRALERDRDVSELQRGAMEEFQERLLNNYFSRHFWIRPKSADPTGFLSKFLAVRGIHSVEIKAWVGPYFRSLIEKCFPKG